MSKDFETEFGTTEFARASREAKGRTTRRCRATPSIAFGWRESRLVHRGKFRHRELLDNPPALSLLPNWGAFRGAPPAGAHVVTCQLNGTLWVYLLASHTSRCSNEAKNGERCNKRHLDINMATIF